MSFQWPVDLAGARYAVIASLTMCLIGPNGPIAAADAATFSADPSHPPLHSPCPQPPCSHLRTRTSSRLRRPRS